MTKTKRTHKDSMFRMLFNDKENLLSLYNALNRTNYENVDDLYINTLENAIFMGMKNDVSCVFNRDLCLFEHQSTVNPNMPLRSLFYLTDVLSTMVTDTELFTTKQKKIPTPKFYVFYNGTEHQDEKVLLKLSSAFENSTDHPALELEVLQLNINEGNNKELMETCTVLKEYMQFVNTVRRKLVNMKNVDEAIKTTVDECIEKGILKEFLMKNKNMALHACLYEYNEERFKEQFARDNYNDGYEAGVAEAAKEKARADAAEERAESAESRAGAAEEKLAKYIEKYGALDE